MAIINQHPTAFEDFVKVPSEIIVQELVGRGFTPMAARRSALATRNVGTQQALQWGVTNARDPRMNHPIIFVSSEKNMFVDKMSIQQIMNTFAFCAQFLSGQKTVNEWLLEHPVTVSSEPMGPPSVAGTLQTGKNKVSNSSVDASGNGGNSLRTEPTSQSRKQPSKEPESPSPQKHPVTKTAPPAAPPPMQSSAAPLPSLSVQAGTSKPSTQDPRPPPPPQHNMVVTKTAPPSAKAPPPAKAGEQSGFSSLGIFQTASLQTANRAMPNLSTSPAPSAKAVQAPVHTTRPSSVQQQSDAIGTHFRRQEPLPSVAPPTLTVKTGTETNQAGKKFTTPTNRPPSLRLGGSAGSSMSSDYGALKKRGGAAMQSMRSSPQNREQTREERKRLIEAGRRLLAKSRVTNPATPEGAASAEPAAASAGVESQAVSSGTNAAASTMQQSHASAPSASSAQQPAAARIFGVAMGSPGDSKRDGSANQSGWSFDEDALRDVESAVETSDGWGFDEQPITDATPPPTAPTGTSTNGTTEVEKLPVDGDNDGWDFEDF
jgi:hypothetical protein